MVGFYLKQIRQGRPYCTGRRSQDETTRFGGVQFLGMSPGMGPGWKLQGCSWGCGAFVCSAGSGEWGLTEGTGT